MKKHTEELRDKYEAQVSQIEAERLASAADIDKMQKSLKDQIEFFKVVYQELETKKSELSSTHQACLQYVRREMSAQEEAHRQQVLKHIDEKKSIFKTYLEQ